MATTSVVPLTGAILTGKTTWGPITPPVGTTAIQVAIDRTSLGLLTQMISWDAEISFDAEGTWWGCGGTGAFAGQITDVVLGLLTESSFIQTLPAPTDVNARLRGSITTLEPLTTSVTVRMS